MIEEYEDQLKAKRAKIDAELEVGTSSNSSGEILDGFQKGYEAERILGVRNDILPNDLVFLMKWKDQEKASYVESEKAKTICPHVVIQFYQERLVWDK